MRQDPFVAPARFAGGPLPQGTASPLSAATLNEIAREPGRARPGPGEIHIVDQMIAERSEGLRSHPLWPLMRPAIYRALGYAQAVELADTVSNMSARGAFDHASGLLGLDIHSTGLERVPRAGGFMIVANHPTGIADGIAMHDLLSPVRDDVVFMANRDALRVNIRLADKLIPVEWREGHKTSTKTRETLKMTARAIERGAALVIFPSGRLARWTESGLTEQPWMPSAVALARKHHLPILPIHVGSRNSGLFYLVSRFSQELRDMTVFHELLNKRGRRFDFTIGRPVDPASFDDTGEATRALQRFVTDVLPGEPDAEFRA